MDAMLRFNGLFVCSSLLLVSCLLSSRSFAQEAAAEATTTSAAPIKSELDLEDSRLFVEIQTSLGNMVVLLEQEKAPITVENFLKYVKKGHYEGTVFHRVIKDFMIQGGGYDQKNLINEKRTDPGIKNEAYNGLSNQRYTLAMARTGDPNSATAQFFINTAPNNFLDKKNSRDGVGYAVFGRVVKGIAVVDKIASVPVKKSANGSPTDGPSEPIEPVVIKKIQVVVPVKPTANP
jgi:cyclophilin family peptidyl-prolyl cis-trans isomerase